MLVGGACDMVYPVLPPCSGPVPPPPATCYALRMSEEDLVIVSKARLVEMRDELDRTIAMIDELCAQRPFLVLQKALCEELVGTREGAPTMRPKIPR